MYYVVDAEKYNSAWALIQTSYIIRIEYNNSVPLLTI